MESTTNTAAVCNLADNYSRTLPKNNKKDILSVLSAVLGFFASTDVKGFNLIHAILYSYKFLRMVRGGPTARPEGDNPSQHDPRERKRIRGTGGYGRNVDENTILDLVQSAFLLFWESQRGRNGQKPEKLSTKSAIGRVCKVWYRRERKLDRIKRSGRYLAILISRIERVVDTFPELTSKEVNRVQFTQILDGLIAGQKKSEIAKEMGVSKAYISKLLRVIKDTRTEQRVKEEEATQDSFNVKISPVNPHTGQYIVNVPLSDGVHCTIGCNYDFTMRHDDTFWFDGKLPNKPTTISGPAATAGSVDTVIPTETAVLQTTPVDPVKLASRYFYVGCPVFRPLVYSDGNVSTNMQWDGLPDNEDGTGI